MAKLNLTCLALLLCASLCSAQEMPEMPTPQKEHEWLEQLAGEWDSETVVTAQEGQPPMKFTGKETARMIGGFWLVAENTGKMMETPYIGIMTLGYDTANKHYVGTWIDSMTGYPWRYKGKVEGNKITLETKGPCPMKPGTLSNFREVLELKSKDEKVFTSEIQQDDGSWTKMVTITYRRSK